MNKENIQKIGIKTADIYLRFPEIMEEEIEDLTEFLEDNHIKYEGATDVVYNLEKENANLKQALIDIKEYIEHKQKIQYKYKFALSHIECDDILQIIDKFLDLDKVRNEK